MHDTGTPPQFSLGKPPDMLEVPHSDRRGSQGAVNIISDHITFGGTKRSELRALHRLASRLPANAVVVEIGSAQGRSTLVLAHAVCNGNGGEVFAIDPFEPDAAIPSALTNNEAALRENIARSGFTNITIIKDFSSNVGRWFDRPIDLLFIDGDHRYEAVKADFDLFEPKIVDGGILAMHDVGVGAGPRRVAFEAIYGSPRFSGLHTVRTMLIARKTDGERWTQPYYRAKHAAYYGLSLLARRLRPG